MSRTDLEKEGITLLGNKKTAIPQDYAPEVLETFINKHPDNDSFVKFNCPEFTSLCFRNHGDFHEDCMNKIMKDLIALMDPKYIEVWGKFTPRGGISIDPYCNYGKPGTKWEEVAWKRLTEHDMYPEKVDNR